MGEDILNHSQTVMFDGTSWDQFLKICFWKAHANNFKLLINHILKISILVFYKLICCISSLSWIISFVHTFLKKSLLQCNSRNPWETFRNQTLKTEIWQIYLFSTIRIKYKMNSKMVYMILHSQCEL